MSYNNILDLTPISPKDKMPAPGEYFHLVVGDDDLTECFPAVSIAYSDPKSFYEGLKVFNKNGDGWMLKVITYRKTKFPVCMINDCKLPKKLYGWIPMFPRTKTYTMHAIINQEIIKM